eukprot:364355-Chlamydomonas_euryale.AAC.8
MQASVFAYRGTCPSFDAIALCPAPCPSTSSFGYLLKELDQQPAVSAVSASTGGCSRGRAIAVAATITSTAACAVARAIAAAIAATAVGAIAYTVHGAIAGAVARAFNPAIAIATAGAVATTTIATERAAASAH